MSRTTTIGAGALALVLLVVGVLVLSTGGEKDPSASSPAPASPAPSGSADPPGGGKEPPSLRAFPPEFVDCLADQGVDVESVTDVSSVIHSPEAGPCLEELHGG